jgi:hypothetical protein
MVIRCSATIPHGASPTVRARPYSLRLLTQNGANECDRDLTPITSLIYNLSEYGSEVDSPGSGFPAGMGICWFVIASDYSDAAASGTYRLLHNGTRSTLVLLPDHSFRQEVSDYNGIQHAEGRWRRLGIGGVAFSRDFLTFPGEQRGEDGTAYSDMQRKFGILIRLSLRTYTVVWYGKTDPAPTDQVAGRYQETEGAKHSRTWCSTPTTPLNKLWRG